MTKIQLQSRVRDLEWVLKHVKNKLENNPYESTVRDVIRDIDFELSGGGF